VVQIEIKIDAVFPDDSLSLSSASQPGPKFSKEAHVNLADFLALFFVV
jgi:hypothetical protein